MDRKVDEVTNEASIDHKIPQKPFKSSIGTYIGESVYRDIGTRLSLRQRYNDGTRYSKYWNHVNVRLYTLLRMLGFQDGDSVFKRFEREGIDDFWLPLDNSLLRKIKTDSLSNFDALEFAKAQFYVMSDSDQMDEHNLVRPFFARQYNQSTQKLRPRHRNLEHGIAHFTDEGKIGEGSSADVRRFRHEDSGWAFACKRLLRRTNTNLSEQRNQLVSFRKEIKALEELDYHCHIVSLVASFTDLESFSLVLHPIADRVLLDLLQQKQPLSDQDSSTLCNSYYCLATALEFLHTQNIRHKDIKPRNILLSNGRVLLCDFGISHKWTDSENGTTEGEYSSFTHRYAAPEVLRIDAKRNLKTDIWSLGCVFLEVLSVMKGYSFDQITKGRGTYSGEMMTWLKNLNIGSDDTVHSLPIPWILTMVGDVKPHFDIPLIVYQIIDDPGTRLSAAAIANNIHADATKHNLTTDFLASCCRRVEAESASELSVSPMQNITPYTSSHVQAGFAHVASDGSSARSNRHGSLAHSRSERSSGPMRNSSVTSTSSTPVSSHVKQGRSHLSNASFSESFSAANTPGITTGTSVRTNSACDEHITLPHAITGPAPDETLRAHLGSRPMAHGSPCSVQEDETLLLEDAVLAISVNEAPTVETYLQCCDTVDRKVRVFETARNNTDTPIWEVTRRLVLSDFTATNTIICHSLWLPLTDIQFFHHDATVTLRWSDCNHPKQEGTSWSWVYDPELTNNEVFIHFRDQGSAKEFVDILRFPQDHGSTLKVSDTVDIYTYDDDAQNTKKLFIATHHNDGSSTSRLYTIDRYIDPLIRVAIQDKLFIAEMRRVESLTYLSNLQRQAQKGKRIARFGTMRLEPCSLTVSADLPTDSNSPVPPACMDSMYWLMASLTHNRYL